MSSTRSEIALDIAPINCDWIETPPPVSGYYGVNTFDDSAMRNTVSADTFSAFKRWQDGGAVISAAQADEIASALKEWAVERGATTYSHWFQPMTGLTAEKHDSFIVTCRDEHRLPPKNNGRSMIAPTCRGEHRSPAGTGGVIEAFTGSKLILGEPDASSFPSGGIRATFEARGYTAWDPSSPAFITEVARGKTLCIPSIFISYNGDALDKKLPLLRSDAAINRAACDLLKLFGQEVRHVSTTCGIEQEFFLVDKRWYNKRADLQLAGRTLVGAASPKDQQLEDQYFGSIKERVLNYMHDVCAEAFKLGIPVTTRHNEVAPGQYEFAPIFERSNLATDNNLLLMDVMKKAALRHDMVCLLHEKPFFGVNGSGKHVNWSLADDSGNNLLNPGDTPEENLIFLTVLTSVVHAMYRHGGLLRASAASAGNEHRLGAHEAPPAIMSVFLGEHLSKIMAMIENGKIEKGKKQDFVDLGVSLLPKFMRDTTDRNRTSPFAFTGSKFEFRAVGSSMNVSTAVTIINTIVADSMDVIAGRIKKELDKSSDKSDRQRLILKVLAGIIKESKNILFEGNNYSDDWAKEAAKRGLPNTPSTAESLKAFIAPDTVKMFERHKVFTKVELAARYNIWLDKYVKTLDIEAGTLAEMINTQILPSAYAYQTDIASGLEILRDLSDDMTIDMAEGALEDRKEVFQNLTADIFYIRKNLKSLDNLLKKSREMDMESRAAFFYGEIKSEMDHIRRHVDALERTMPDELWPLPKYREMLFIL